MKDTDTLKVPVSEVSKRLDVFISEKTGTTRSQVQKLIKQGYVLVNNKREQHGYKVRPDDSVVVARPHEDTAVLVPEPLPLRILFEDEHIVVVDKPAGLVVYPAAGHSHGTLLNALRYHCGKLASVGGPLRSGVVHRLDKDTSGIIVVALDDGAYYGLVEQFRNRTIQRRYKALVYGNPKEESGQVTLHIGRSTSDRKKMSTRTRRGKEAVTRWRVLKRFGHATLIEAALGTGRTHQIRVHFSALGHPVLGDRTYGKKNVLDVRGLKIHFPRQMLHAETLGFVHPVTGEQLKFSSPLPDDMEECIRKLTEAGTPYW